MNVLLIYCVWLWIVSIWFLLDIYPYSPLLGLILGLSFTIINNVFNPQNKNLNNTRKYGIIFWELFVLLVVLRKSRKLDVVHNLVLFAIYLVYLFINNTSFRDVYFNKLRNIDNTYSNDSFIDHIFRLIAI